MFVERKVDKRQVDSNYMQNALIRHFDWMQQTIIPNAYFAGGEMDLLVISKARYLTEVEIKISKADWNNDKGKSKWADPERDKVCRFFYAVPWYLQDSMPSWVPNSAGLIVVNPSGYITVRVPAARSGSYKITDAEYMMLMHRVYCRYMQMRNRIKGLHEDVRLEIPYNNVSTQGVSDVAAAPSSTEPCQTGVGGNPDPVDDGAGQSGGS